MNEEDLDFYNMQDKEELVWMCISRDNRIKSLQQENQKLKHIIEKLEKYLRSYIKIMNNNPDIIETGQIDILHEVLDKLKQLQKEGK